MTSAFLRLLTLPETIRFGWALVHFLWQGAVIVALLEAALALTGRANAALRYIFCGLALTLMPVCLISTYVFLGGWTTHAPALTSPVNLPDSVSITETVIPPVLVVPISHGRAATLSQDVRPFDLDACMPLVVTVWILGVIVLAARKAGGFYVVWRLRHCGIAEPIEALQEQFRRVCLHLGVNPGRVVLRISSLVTVPMTMGWLAPVVLFPACLLSGLTPEEIELLLAHELAHIRRRDYLVNILQTVVETIFFYHPATWWISRRMRQERENACDDLVSTDLSEVLAYAKVLILLETQRPAGSWLAVGANGGKLLHRIQRLAGERAPSPLAGSVVGLVTVFFLTVLAAVSLISAQVNHPYTLKQLALIANLPGEDLHYKPAPATQPAKNPALTKALVDAAGKGDIAGMDRLLKQGADPNDNGKPSDGQDALYLAVQNDHADAVAFLLQHGADPNHLNAYRQPLLSKVHDVAIMKLLLEAGANPNVEDIFGPPLVEAANAECVRLLVQHGANVRPKLKNGNTLIEAALVCGIPDRGDVIEELIKQGAEFDSKGQSGAGALTAAAQLNNVEVIKVLLDHGVSPDAFNDGTYAKDTAVGTAAWEPSTDALKYLLQRGANPEGDPREEESPLGMAIIFGEKANEDVLLKAGVHDVGELSMAAAAGDAAKVRGLLDNGANINEADRMGNTPLYYACRRAHVEIAQLLLEHGASPSQFNAYGMTPKSALDLMAASGSADQYQMDWSVPEDEGKRRMAAFDALFAKYPPDPHFRDSHGRTALHQAILFGNTELELINKGHPIDANTPDGEGTPPLLLAVRSPHVTDISTRISTYENYKTPRQKLKEWNSQAYIVDQLIKAGAKLDSVAANGETMGELAMDAARKANNAQLVSVIQAAQTKAPQ